MMSTPAILLMRTILSWRNCPMNVAEAPRAIKTSENPAIKSAELSRIFFLTRERLSSFCISSKVTPEMKERYPGTMGNTQGEMKDSNPNANAVIIPTFSNLNPQFRHIDLLKDMESSEDNQTPS